MRPGRPPAKHPQNADPRLSLKQVKSPPDKENKRKDVRSTVMTCGMEQRNLRVRVEGHNYYIRVLLFSVNPSCEPSAPSIVPQTQRNIYIMTVSRYCLGTIQIQVMMATNQPLSCPRPSGYAKKLLDVEREAKEVV